MDRVEQWCYKLARQSVADAEEIMAKCKKEDRSPYVHDLCMASTYTGEAETLIVVAQPSPGERVKWEKRIKVVQEWVREASNAISDMIAKINAWPLCPHCGERAPTVSNSDDLDPRHKRINPVKCSNCHGVGGYEDFYGE